MPNDLPRYDEARALEAAEAASPVDAVQAVTRELHLALGALSVSFLIADLSGRALVRLTHQGPGAEPDDGAGDGTHRQDDGERATVLPFDGGPLEQVVRSQSVQVLGPAAGADGGREGGTGQRPAGAWTVLAPVTERGDCLGVLEMRLPREPDGATVAEISRAAHLLAFVVIANRRHTDLFEWGQRTRAFNLPAEIQRRLLPAAFTCEAEAFTLSAWLEPAASVGGDTFDYSLARDVLHLTVTDAMGHGVTSALTATLCVGSLRAARRRGDTLVEQALFASTSLAEASAEIGSEVFVTGLLGRLDLATGRLALVNAGHVAPYLVRDGVAAPVDLRPEFPLGMFPAHAYRSSELALRPGDRLVLVTDGMLERDAGGFDMVQGLSQLGALHPREAVSRLAASVLETTGHALGDDALVMVVDWYGGHGGDRSARAGADRSRASARTAG